AQRRRTRRAPHPTTLVNPFGVPRAARGDEARRARQKRGYVGLGSRTRDDGGTRRVGSATRSTRRGQPDPLSMANRPRTPLNLTLEYALQHPEEIPLEHRRTEAQRALVAG